MADDANKPKPTGSLGNLVQAESMLQMAIALPAGCLIGWFLGDRLDHHFHTSWMAITGILLGIAAGFIQLFTTATRYMKRGSQ
jgi:ATP synthase protein I